MLGSFAQSLRTPVPIQAINDLSGVLAPGAPFEAILELALALQAPTRALAMMPAVYASRQFVEAGGLLAYGVSYSDLYYRAATYVDQIRKGAKPSDIPVQQPTKFEMLINMKTATTLSLTIPQSVILRADEVIE